MLKTHLDVLQEASLSYASEPAFRLPIPRSSASDPFNWEIVTYAKFYEDVLLLSQYWAQQLGANDIPQRSVIGLWTQGTSYIDALYIYGLSRAGYIPQLFSIRLPNPDVVFELLGKTGAKALVCDAKLHSIAVEKCPVPLHVAPSLSDINSRDDVLPILPTVSQDDIAFCLHTSGSTAGSPKLIPFTYSWLHSMVEKSRTSVCAPYNKDRRDVVVWMGSMFHISQTYQLVGSIQHGTCIVQPTSIPFSSKELVDMITNTGLNRLTAFAPYLTVHFKSARQDPVLRSMLASLDEVLTTGMALPQHDIAYADKAGFPLVTLYGSTETGVTMMSDRGRGNDPNTLRFIDGVVYELQHIPQTTDSDETRLYKLVILAQSPDCPHISIRDGDGNFRPGDLLLKSGSGTYNLAGRDDDWIKSLSALRCNTKTIEDNVRETCSDIVSDCIVVGNGRPSPVLFVEPSTESGDDTYLKKTIFQRIQAFHSRRYLHERIISENFIVVVIKGTLPRSALKGNIRRTAVEEVWKDMLDGIYSPGP